MSIIYMSTPVQNKKSKKMSIQSLEDYLSEMVEDYKKEISKEGAKKNRTLLLTQMEELAVKKALINKRFTLENDS